MYSHERYRIIFIWKVLKGYVQGYNLPLLHSPRRAHCIKVAQYNRRAPDAVRQAKEASLPVHGARVFNLLPRHLRDISTGTVDQFKNQLDIWLQTIPDQPTVPGRQRAALTNSLIDQVTYGSSSLVF